MNLKLVKEFKKKVQALDWFKIFVSIGAIAIPASGGYLALRINYSVSEAKAEIKRELEQYVDNSLVTKAPWTKNEKYVLQTIESTKQTVNGNATKIDALKDRVGSVERTMDKIDNKIDLIIKKADM